MFDSSKFVPKKAMPFGPKIFEVIGGDETFDIAQYVMTLLPPLPPDSVIHDAACGPGAVTRGILGTSPPDTVKLEATDKTPLMVNIYNNNATKNKWPSNAAIMDAQKLSFPDSTFSHSFLSFGLPIIDDPVAAAKEIYRTLKPGGTAITAFWLQISQGECAQAVARSIRGPDAKLAIEPKPQHKDRGYIRSLLVEGGFKFEDVQLYEKSAFMHVKDLDQFAIGIWTTIGQPLSGWTPEDEETWDDAVAMYKKLLEKSPGYSVDADGKIKLEAIAQIAIVQKPGV